jgi:hypothetical protein
MDAYVMRGLARWWCFGVQVKRKCSLARNGLSGESLDLLGQSTEKAELLKTGQDGHRNGQ